MSVLKSVLFLGFLFLTACSNLTQPHTPQNCESNHETPECVLGLSLKALQAEEEPGVWINGASEVALALDAVGQPDRAIELLKRALERAPTIEDLSQRKRAYGDILTASAGLKQNEAMLQLMRTLPIDYNPFNERARADLKAKYSVVLAVHDTPQRGLEAALILTQKDDYDANYKAVALRKIAQVFAERGDLAAARRAIDEITMSISYYQALARTDVARESFNIGLIDKGLNLVAEAVAIGRAQSNGYFVGAALRDAGYSLYSIARVEPAMAKFEEAILAAHQAEKQNEKARALSRIATRLADAELFDRARPVLVEAIALAEIIETETILGFTYYEIAGSAAFSGAFDMSHALIEKVPDAPFGAAQSLKGAAQRDLAWGQARFDKRAAAIETCARISTNREQIQCYARLARVIAEPTLDAPSRYL